MNEVFTIAWIAAHFVLNPCPLKDPIYAEGLGLKAHTNCPMNHSAIEKQVYSNHSRITTSSTTAMEFYQEISGMSCGLYKSEDWGFDCIQSATLKKSNEVIQSW